MTPLSHVEQAMIERILEIVGGRTEVHPFSREALPHTGETRLLVGEPGEELPSEIEGVYVTRIRLVPSEVFAFAGGPFVEGKSTREVLIAEARSTDASARKLPPELASDRFSITEYAALLNGALDGGYRFVSFEEALAMGTGDASRVVLLRHDIDLSPLRALRMAEVEASIGVRSTYFFMLSGAFYDLLEPEHRNVVRRVLALGHEVGFHYDEHDDIAEGLEILSAVARKPLRHIAQHNPTLLPRRGLENKSIVDAYDPRITGDNAFAYVSDSGMKWRQKTFADLLSEGAPRIYALCHPETWLTDGRDMIEMIRWVEADEKRRRHKRYDAFVEGNIHYLRARKERERRKGEC